MVSVLPSEFTLEYATRADPEPLSSSSSAQDANQNPSAATAANTANVFKNFFIK